MQKRNKTDRERGFQFCLFFLMAFVRVLSSGRLCCSSSSSSFVSRARNITTKSSPYTNTNSTALLRFYNTTTCPTTPIRSLLSSSVSHSALVNKTSPPSKSSSLSLSSHVVHNAKRIRIQTMASSAAASGAASSSDQQAGYFILHYEYVPDILEKRDPYRYNSSKENRVREREREREETVVLLAITH